MPETAIPDDVCDALGLPEEERESAVLRELAVSLDAHGAPSFGTARAFVDLSNVEFHRIHRAEGQFQRHRRVRELDYGPSDELIVHEFSCEGMTGGSLSGTTRKETTSNSPVTRTPGSSSNSATGSSNVSRKTGRRSGSRGSTSRPERAANSRST